jgi:membrane protein CcdC involved in cytochrome C biogenesis
MEQPVNFTLEVGPSSDGFQLRQIGLIALIMGSLMLLLVFAENTPVGRTSIGTIAGFVMSTGLVMLAVALRRPTDHR